MKKNSFELNMEYVKESGMTKVKIYTTNYCPYSRKAKALLDKLGVNYQEIDITDNEPEMRIKLGELTGGVQSVPQIFINGKLLGGCDSLYEAYDSGELEKILKL